MNGLALASSLPTRVGDERTLEQALAMVSEELAARGLAKCPLCQGEMEPQYGAHVLPISARCTVCGTTLE